MTRTRVLFCIPELDRGGPDAVFFNLLRALDPDRFEAFVALAWPGGAYQGELPSHIPVLEVGPHKYPVRGLIRAVRTVQPDVVLTTLRMNVAGAAASPAFGRRIPLICRVANNLAGELEDQTHRSSAPKTRAIALSNRMMVTRATALVAQSSAMREDIRRRYGGRAHAKTVVLPNPVDLDRVALRGSMAPARDLVRGHPQLVSAGRLTFQKGFDRLIDAFATIRRSQPGARLWLLGEGEDRDDLERSIADLGLSDAVDLPGFVDNPVPYYLAADLYVCSSRYEGFPNSVAEALAVGTPIVVPWVAAGGDELVTPTNGRRVDHGTAEELADAALDILAHPEAFPAAAITAECEARFSVRTVTTRYEELLWSTATAHPRAPESTRAVGRAGCGGRIGTTVRRTTTRPPPKLGPGSTSLDRASRHLG